MRSRMVTIAGGLVATAAVLTACSSAQGATVNASDASVCASHSSSLAQVRTAIQSLVNGPLEPVNYVTTLADGIAKVTSWRTGASPALDGILSDAQSGMYATQADVLAQSGAMFNDGSKALQAFGQLDDFCGKLSASNG